MKRQLTLMLSLVMIALLILSGCKAPVEQTPTAEPTAEVTAEPTAEPTPEPTPEPQVLTDVLGREITLNHDDKIERIISLTASNTEILFALGLGDKIVGIDAFSNYPADTADIEKVGDFNGPNVEAIVALKPDLILAGNKLQADAVQTLSDLGLRVAAVEATLYDEIDESITLIGALTRSEDAAKTLIESMNEKQEATLSKEKSEAEVTCYYIMSAGDYGNWTSGPGSFVNDMMLSLGITPVTQIDGGAAWMDYNLEELVKADPQVILLDSQAGVDTEALKEMTGYKDLTAVKEGSVHIIESDLISRPGPRIVDALQAMYDAVFGS